MSHVDLEHSRRLLTVACAAGEDRRDPDESVLCTILSGAFTGTRSGPEATDAT